MPLVGFIIRSGFLIYCGLIGYKIMQPDAVVSSSRQLYINLPT